MHITKLYHLNLNEMKSWNNYSTIYTLIPFSYNTAHLLDVESVCSALLLCIYCTYIYIPEEEPYSMNVHSKHW